MFFISITYSPMKNSHRPCRKPWSWPSKNAAPRWRRTSSSPWGSRARRPANRITTTGQHSIATLARNGVTRTRESGKAVYVRPSTLFCFCRRAAWSRLLDISFIPKSCAEKTNGREGFIRHIQKADRWKKPRKSAGTKGRNGGSNGRKERGIHHPWIGPSSVVSRSKGNGPRTGVLTSRCLRFSRTLFLRCSS